MTELNIDVQTLLHEMSGKIQQLDIYQKSPKMIGIRTGGVWVAQSLHKSLQLPDELGVLNISFYRDDFSKVGLNPSVEPSDIPWDVNDQHIILVDDVLYTGRTTRAALNEIFDFGRPASVTLVSLFDRRGCRELPFQADVVGMQMDCHQTLKLSGPDPLKVTFEDHPEE
ncbi:bifunctional pyr operon transcriptional regulator/uracil phosphoribosyltransferase PyrR [Thiomicrorhabdus indica]|uniref:bifunctional pyr operon transcriptional regulator/uracil phosphoribosyltransferase PyrR n=1 Tax=Thiomicrorhabdus indica TaxID=2267253 RepID=UPI00102DE271|nr:bifunctional pyr operon transcriptional regulator/uracil phosphoribosyltransferase PyrR [Thiomicrorhabdus indica]